MSKVQDWERKRDARILKENGVDPEMEKIKRQAEHVRGLTMTSKVQPPGTAFSGPPQRDKRPTVPDHLVWIRTLPCVACGLPDHSDPHHIKPACERAGKRESGTQKPDDCWTVPLCRPCHDQLHRDGNEVKYWSRYGGIYKAVCWAACLWAGTGNDYRGEQIVRGHLYD